jgi:hypothetical protein
MSVRASTHLIGVALSDRIGLRGAHLARRHKSRSTTDCRGSNPGTALGGRSTTGCREHRDRAATAVTRAGTVLTAALAFVAPDDLALRHTLTFETAGAFWAGFVRVRIVDAALDCATDAGTADLIVCAAHDFTLVDALAFEAGLIFQTGLERVGIVDATLHVAADTVAADANVAVVMNFAGNILRERAVRRPPGDGDAAHNTAKDSLEDRSTGLAECHSSSQIVEFSRVHYLPSLIHSPSGEDLRRSIRMVWHVGFVPTPD